MFTPLKYTLFLYKFGLVEYIGFFVLFISSEFIFDLILKQL